MAAEPSNTASEALRYACGALSGMESAPGDTAWVTDDWAYEDRRRGPSFAIVDAETHQRFVQSVWQTGAGRPEFAVTQILAVRGDRFVAARVRLDYGNGMLFESIHVLALDATLSLSQREVDFDLDDVDGAIAELDRLHSESEAR